MPPTDKQLANLALARARALEVRAAFASSSKEEKADILRARAEKLVTKRVKKIASPLAQPSEESSVVDGEILQPVETPLTAAPEPQPTVPEPQSTVPEQQPTTPEVQTTDLPKKEKAAVMRDGKRRRRIIILDSSSDDEQPPPTRPPVSDDLGIYRRLGLF
jgi:hypothetical protein